MYLLRFIKSFIRDKFNTVHEKDLCAVTKILDRSMKLDKLPIIKHDIDYNITASVAHVKYYMLANIECHLDQEFPIDYE